MDVPVLVLDCNYDLLTDKKKLLDYVGQVEQFIQNHSQKMSATPINKFGACQL